jgi:hypothetical protein
MGQDLPAGQGGRRWSSPEWHNSVEVVVRSDAEAFDGGGGAWSLAVSSDKSCGWRRRWGR